MSRSATGFRRIGRFLFVAIGLVVCSAHVGSPDVWFDGNAGPYSVRVLIRPPRVVPGLADIVVRVRDGGVDRVLVAPAHANTGPEGMPPPDVAQPVASDAGAFSAQLWLMARGAYRIIVTVQGDRGEGVAVVPVNAAASERLGLSPMLAGVLTGAALFLLVGLITIVGAGVREAALPPGEVPSPARRRRARAAMAVGSVIVAVLVFGGWRWWSAVDAWHRARLDRPWTTTATVIPSAQGARLVFEIADSAWHARLRAGVKLIPDHGKLMHMFLVREDLDGFAHVHPQTTDAVRFDVPLPVLPAGRYRVFADIVEETGLTRTLTASVDVATLEHPPAGGADHDDAAWSADHAQRVSARWSGINGLQAGEETELMVELSDSTGAPLVLEPYMGMAAHAMLQHEDGSVFVHLHPLGTISAAAQQLLAERAGIVAANQHTAHAAASRVAFPYAFPKPGRYRVWVQFRSAGQVFTVANDVTVG